MGFKGKPGLGVITGLDPVCPQCGPYEASEGIYPGHRRIKNWGWAKILESSAHIKNCRYPLTTLQDEPLVSFLELLLLEYKRMRGFRKIMT